MNLMSNFSFWTGIPVWGIWLVALAVLILGAGRLTRVITYDDFPPTIKMRVLWDKLTDDSEWNKLLHCFWCFGFWAGLLGMSWFGVGLIVEWVMIAWWAVFGALAVGYVISMVVARDEPAEGGTD